MNESEALYAVLIEAISEAQRAQADVSNAAEEAAKAFSAGLKAFEKVTAVSESP